MADESKTIKEVFDGDPTGGNDPFNDYLFAADKGTGVPVVVSSQQLANNIDYKSLVIANHELRLAALEANQPPPQPGPVSWFADIPNNVLNFTVGANNWDGEAYLLTFNDANTPSYPGDFSGTYGGIGTTVPTSFPVPDIADSVLAYSSTYNVRLWKYTVAGGVELTDVVNSTLDYVEIIPNYTLEPGIPTGVLAVASGADGSGQMTVSWTDPDVPNGISDRKIGVYYEGEDPAGPPTIREVVGQTSPAVVTSLPVGIPIFAQVEIVSNNTLSSYAVSEVLTLPEDTTPTFDGKFSFVKTTELRELEDSGKLTVTVQLVGRQTTNDASVNVRTKQNTALPGTVSTFNTGTGVASGTETITTDAPHNISVKGTPCYYTKNSQGVTGNTVDIGATDATTYYAAQQGASTVKLYTTQADAVTDDGVTNIVDLTSSGSETHYLITGNYENITTQTVTVPNGAGTATFTIDLVDNELTSNKCFEAHMIPGSATGTADIALYPDNAILIFINGTGGANSNTYAISNSVSDGIVTCDGFVIEAEKYSLLAPQSGAAGVWTEYLPTDNLPTNQNPAEGNNTNIMFAPNETNYTSVDYQANSPRLDYYLDFSTTTGTFYLWLRAWARASWENKIWIGLDGTNNWSNGTTECVAVNAASAYKWYQVIVQGGTAVTTNITTGGEHTLNLWVAQDNLIVDKIIVANNSALDPSLVGAAGTADPVNDDTVGPAVTGFVPAILQDDVNNLNAPTDPLPSGADYDFTASSPADGATNVGLQVPVVMIWPIGSQRITPDPNGIIESDGTNTLSGSYSSAGNRLTWEISQERAPNTLHDITGSGTVVQPDGTVSPWTISATDLDFTTLNPAGPGVQLDMDLSAYADNTLVTPTILNDVFGTPGTPATAALLQSNPCYIITDPLGSGQKVLSISIPPSSGGLAWNLTIDFASALGREAYMMAEYAVSSNWISNFSIHGPMFRSQKYVAGNIVQPDIYSLEMEMRGNNTYLESVWPGTLPSQIANCVDNAAMAYCYHQGDFQQPMFSNLDNPTLFRIGNLPQPSQTQFSSTAYHQVENHIRLSSIGGGNVLNSDGLYEQYFDGQLSMQSANLKTLADGQIEDLQLVGFRFWLGSSAPERVTPPQQQYIYLRRFVISTNSISF